MRWGNEAEEWAAGSVCKAAPPAKAVAGLYAHSFCRVNGTAASTPRKTCGNPRGSPALALFVLRSNPYNSLTTTQTRPTI